MPNPVTHFEIIGKDGEKLKQFYSQLFDWAVDSSNPMNYGMVSPQDSRGIGGGIASSQDGGAGYVTVYVEVSNAQEYLDKAVNLGATVVMPAMAVPGGPTIALFTDPEGHVVGIAESMEHGGS